MAVVFHETGTPDPRKADRNPNCCLARDVSAGSVLIPAAVEHPVRCRKWVGAIVTRDLRAGAILSDSDVLLLKEDELCPLDVCLLDGSNGLRRQVLTLDRLMFKELGMAYADKPWTAANFDHLLPGKSELSFVFLRSSRVLGFWIASERVAGEAHTHRVAVDRSWRNGVLSRGLFCAFWRAAIGRPGVCRMTVEVGADNMRARSFYQTLGFWHATPKETISYLKGRGRNEMTNGMEILGSGGDRTLVMLRHIETEL